jgi:hypothetical protein
LILLGVGPLAAAMIDRPPGLDAGVAAVFVLTAAGLLAALGRSDRLVGLGADGPVRTANVVGRFRSGASRRLVLVAHHDTKSQPLSLAGRAALVTLLAVGWAAMPVEAAAGAMLSGAWLARALDPLLLAGGAAGLGLAWGGGVWRDRSPGALDNAASVLCVLEAARRLAADPPEDLELVVAFTGGEEHMMLGARSLVRWLEEPGRAGSAFVVNLDGVGEPGPVGIVGPSRYIAPLREAARRVEVAVRRVRLPPGAVTDAVPLRRAGLPVVGLTSGRLGPGARAVHTPRDRVENVDPRTMEEVVRLLVSLGWREEIWR